MVLQIKNLTEQVKSLLETIELLKNGRKSNTSSTPSSQDLQRSNSRNLREKSARMPGGQFGHQGNTLKMSPTPEEEIEHRCDFCRDCGKELLQEAFKLVHRRQEIVIAPIVPQYVEHRSYSCVCSQCGTNNEALLAPHLKGNIQYHPDVCALVGYFSARHYVAYNRVTEVMRDVFNIPLSEGTVDNMLAGLALNATPAYEAIQERLMQAEVVGGDETGVRINGKKGWLFTFQNQCLTFIAVALSRGFASIELFFKDGFPKAVYVTDCLAAQLKTAARLHQICIVHLLRELNNFIATFDCKWSTDLKTLFKQAIEIKKEFTPDHQYEKENEQVKMLEKRLDVLLQTDLTDKHPKLKAFAKRLNKNRDAIFTFLYHPKVPPDNNGSEKAIRTAKVKTKVSGQFKILDGANRFAILRSIIDTAIKNKMNPLKALFSVANYAAE